MTTLGSTLSTVDIAKADLSDVSTSATPEIARLGFGGPAGSTARITLPATASLAGGIDFGGSASLQYVSAGKIKFERPSGGTSTFEINAASGQDSYLSLAENGTSAWNIQSIGSGSGNFVIRDTGSATPRNMMVFAPADGTSTWASINPVHNTTGSPTNHTLGLSMAHTIDAITKTSSFNQIRTFTAAQTVGATTSVAGTPIAGGLTVNLKSAQAPTGGGFNEAAYLFACVADENTDATTNNHHQIWGQDTAVHGPIAIQNRLLANANFHINNYYNGSPTLGDAVGASITTGYSKGAGITTAHSTAQTYPVDVGLAIVGTSGSTVGGTQRLGFTTGIRIGGEDAPWWFDAGIRSRIGNGMLVEDYETYGIRVWKRSTVGGTSPPAISIGWKNDGTASTLAYDGLDLGGDVNLYRGAADVLRTDDNFGINQSAGGAPAAAAGGWYFTNAGAMNSYRTTAGLVFRAYVATGAGADAEPKFRITTTTNGATLEWGPGGSTAPDVNLFRKTGAILRTDNAMEIGGALTATGAANVTSLATTSITTSGTLNVVGTTTLADALFLNNTATGYMQMITQTSAVAASGTASAVRMYVRNGYLVFVINDGGTTRYLKVPVTSGAGGANPAVWSWDTTAP